MYIFFYIQRNDFQKKTFESIFHPSLEDQDEIRDLYPQLVSNGCETDSLIPNAWVSGIVINAFKKKRRKRQVIAVQYFPHIFSKTYWVGA